ncbi:hypothetical protein BUALT_Bualt06G0089500 [Buddleja alternifolia]|uniref:Protein PLASTID TRANSCRIPTIONALLY ACTIVE 7 n=1 Tax=Buddleja alternifolia TaxID=168488 RepID=A0AAV6XKS1_9LAMI|nr:hypothetical protein BUALT_Bualt06G0089500 [Buddleja alternifolia]
MPSATTEDFVYVNEEAGDWREPILSYLQRGELPRDKKIEVKSENKWRSICAMKSQVKRDDMLDYRMERIPFLEEQVRKIKDTGKLLTMDIERLLLSEDNRFDFVNEVAAEAKQYVESNRDEYGAKKAILHVLSNRMNDAGFYRAEGYIEDDPFKPGPGYLREEI